MPKSKFLYFPRPRSRPTGSVGWLVFRKELNCRDVGTHISPRGVSRGALVGFNNYGRSHFDLNLLFCCVYLVLVPFRNGLSIPMIPVASFSFPGSAAPANHHIPETGNYNNSLLSPRTFPVF